MRPYLTTSNGFSHASRANDDVAPTPNLLSLRHSTSLHQQIGTIEVQHMSVSGAAGTAEQCQPMGRDPALGPCALRWSRRLRSSTE